MPTKARASAHIRYTTLSQWIVTKGQSIRKLGYGAIQSAAELIANAEDFRGAAFSFGDGLIDRMASRTAVGNPSMWRAAGVNHHAAVVLEQLRVLFGIPAPAQEAVGEQQTELFSTNDDR